MTMTQAPEKMEETVLVKCEGIAIRTGFQMAPDGYAPDYVEFNPGEPTPVKKIYADYLVKTDKDRFSIVEKPKAVKPETGDDKTEADKIADKAAKKAEKEAAKAAKK